MNKTILIASNLYKPNIGGVENSLGHMAESFTKSGHDVIIFASDISRLDSPLPALEVEGNITIMRYKVESYKGVLRYVMHWVNGIKLLRSINVNHKPVLSISRFHVTCLMLSLSGYKAYVYIAPGVVKFQNAFLKNATGVVKKIRGWLNYSLNLWFQSQAFKRCKVLYLFSDNMVEQVTSVTDKAESKICVVKPGVDLERFVLSDTDTKISIRKSLNLTNDGPVFLCIGRVIKDKGFDLAIMALRKLPSVTLWIVGDGEETGALEALVEELNLGSQVHFIAGTNTPETYFSAADFFIMSSRYEPLGQTILEALACGLPIIAFKNSQKVMTATQELLGNDGAYYATEPTPESLAGVMLLSLKSLQTNEYSSIAHKNRMLAQKKYNWQTLCGQLLADSNK